MRQKFRIDAEGECALKFPEGTYDYHQCICQYEFPIPSIKKYLQLKVQHCLIAGDTLKRTNFENYLYIALTAGVVLIVLAVIVCTYKWYSKVNNNPFSKCFNCKKKKKKNEADAAESHWTTVQTDVEKQDTYHDSRHNESTTNNSSLCMKFCMSDPVQDCCEFFDCDILWRRKNIYMIPIFGRRKMPGPLQRRPTRPAPPPPKAIVTPVMKYPEPIVCDDFGDCDPVPEAPPSPEPVRTTQPKAQSKGMYVDPIAFLQKPFMKSREKTEDGPDPLYSRVKDYVLGKVRKSASMASLNKLGVSANPDGSLPQNGTKSGKYSKTASLASLHDLSDNELDKNYSTKRSQSLASLHMHDDEVDFTNSQHKMLGAPGCRMSMDMDDIPPAARKDEYIDLEEMSKRIAAKMDAQGTTPSNQQQNNPPSSPTAPASYTPNFIPASAFSHHAPPNRNPSFSTFQQIPNTSSMMESVQSIHSKQYCPPIPASGGRPAVPARTTIGSPIPNQTGTLGRSKPVIPPRPPPNDFGRQSPKARGPALQNHRASPSPVPRASIIKPSGPPPPPPSCPDVPIESSI